jgi:hypothetical protein
MSSLRVRSIASARAVIPGFDTIADICDLQPLNGWSKWEDYSGNRLTITKKKSILVYPSESPLQKTSDFLRLSTPKMIAQYSYWLLYIRGGKDTYMFLMGNDGRLRCCKFTDGKWKGNLDPLCTGICCVRICSDRYMENVAEKISEEIVLANDKGFVCEEAFITPYPVENKNLRGKIECLLTR